MTMVNSPRVSAPSLVGRASAARSPRRTSSCSLVSSRQTAAWRGAEPFRQRRERARRRAGRFRTGSASPECGASSAMRVRRWPSFAGRKPSKKNRSVGRPATLSAASAAEAPGTAITGEPGLARRAHQLEAGIGNQRRAGVRNQRDRPRRRRAAPAASAAPLRRCARGRASAGWLCRNGRAACGSPWCPRRRSGRRRPAFPARASVMSRRFPIGVATRCRPAGEARRLDRLPGQDVGLGRDLPACRPL